jgi:hypothetical protein
MCPSACLIPSLKHLVTLSRNMRSEICNTNTNTKSNLGHVKLPGEAMYIQHEVHLFKYDGET